MKFRGIVGKIDALVSTELPVSKEF
jgi:hypothetical protein